MDPGHHNAAYLQAKRTKLGHLMEDSASGVGREGEAVCGLTAVLSWKGDAAAAELAERSEQLRCWLLERGLVLEREEHPRLLALLAQPSLALLLAAPLGGQLHAADLAACLQRIAAWPHGRGVSLLLAPDGRRVEHPTADLEPEIRPLSDLLRGEGDAVARSCPRLQLQPGAFVMWR
jgi:3,4-dihydroxy 2-butanone 4-phosphate synthase/GTP cyclohydrolase II